MVCGNSAVPTHLAVRKAVVSSHSVRCPAADDTAETIGVGGVTVTMSTSVM